MKTEKDLFKQIKFNKKIKIAKKINFLCNTCAKRFKHSIPYVEIVYFMKSFKRSKQITWGILHYYFCSKKCANNPRK